MSSEKKCMEIIMKIDMGTSMRGIDEKNTNPGVRMNMKDKNNAVL